MVAVSLQAIVGRMKGGCVLAGRILGRRGLSAMVDFEDAKEGDLKRGKLVLVGQKDRLGSLMVLIKGEDLPTIVSFTISAIS